MTSQLEAPPGTTSSSPAQRLRGTTAAVALHFTWFGVRKSLNTEQKAQAADAFGAEGSYLSAGKKLIDTSHPAFKAVTALKSQIVQFSKSMSLPYPEPGIRLIRRDEIGMFDTRLTTLRQELDEAVSNLSDHFSELKSAARRRLGRLYNPADYPDSLVGLFGVSWEYPNCEPPAYLQQLSPELYEEESRRVAARFEECIRLAEEAFGPAFKRPSAKTLRLERAKSGPKLFTADEIRRALKVANGNMAATILLGINGGLGNTDLGELPMSAIDLKGGWLNYPRPKTGVPRRIPLWKETIAAIRKVIDQRREPKDEVAKGLLFIGSRGENYAGGYKGGPISKQFQRTLERAGFNSRTFYDLRRTFQTIGEGARDLVAEQNIMGHAPASSDMSSIYRQGIDDDRLRAVVEHVRTWIYAKPAKGPAKTNSVKPAGGNRQTASLRRGLVHEADGRLRGVG